MTARSARDPEPSENPHFQPLRCIGLMSGTSMDGVDAAVVETDGAGVIARGLAFTAPYDPGFRARLKAFTLSSPARDGGAEERALEAEITDLHARAVQELAARAGGAFDLVGFHGQTIWHKPEVRETWQMGDGARLAKAVGIPVAFDFRSADVHAGGHGAPLLPIFHAALLPRSAKPTAILNVGGVANITWIPGGAAGDPGAFTALMGFDTGPGNGLVDDLMARHFGQSMDTNGAVAARGRVDETALAALLAAPYFAKAPPKSLDRFAFTLAPVAHLGPEDAVTTMTAFTAAAVARGLDLCPGRPDVIYVAGGGRHNATLMRMLGERCGVAVESVDALGWQGDALEAQAFAYLAVRCLRGLPITFPGTTGAKAPLAGGRLAKP